MELTEEQRIEVEKVITQKKETLERESKEGRPCPKIGNEKVAIMACFWCEYGHLTGCHYPDASHSMEKCGHEYE